MKRIGLVTTGGDCAGLNPAIRALTLIAHQNGYEVLGFKKGTLGLLHRDFTLLTPENIPYDLMTQGGSFLGAISKGNPFQYVDSSGNLMDISGELAASYKALGLECIVSIGGDGSFSISNALHKKFGINIIGIPKTIDNDLASSELSIGFHSAVQQAVNAIDDIRTTAKSHERVFVLQTMGRDAGHLALAAGIAGGVDVILIPEVPYNFEAVKKAIQRAYNQKKYALVVVSEAIKTIEGKTLMVTDQVTKRPRYQGMAYYLAEEIEEHLGLEARPFVLGHIQRGGGPIAFDRLLASTMAMYAFELVQQKKYGYVVVLESHQVSAVPIEETIKSYKYVDIEGMEIKTARHMGICLGDQ